MGKHDKIKAGVMSGQRDNNIRFRDMQNMLLTLGFRERVNGDHFIYNMSGLPIITLQPEGNLAKAYQVAQVRRLLHKYGL